MIENNRIIIVDDNSEHLNQLREVFYLHGIGCKGFEYDGLTFPNEPLRGVRFAFFDIHLNQANDINSTLKDAISHYISVDNGPYILIFWSNNTDKVSEFTEFINRENDEFKNRLKPIHLTAIDKSEFLDKNNKLDEKIKSIFSSDIVKCLIGFDESVLIAAQQTINRIFNIIPFPDKWGESKQFNTICENVFSKIAENTYGLFHAKSSPDLAVKEAIVPIFKHLLFDNEDDYWKNYLTTLQNAQKANDIKFPDNFKVEQLNSILHIDNNRLANKSITDRGAVCKFITNKFEDNFKEYFRINYTDWFKNTFHVSDEEQIKKSTPIVIEFSAACDFCQNKPRTNKYMLGALLPFELRKKIKNVGEYTFLFPFNFEFDSKSWLIGLNFNYTFTVSNSDNLLVQKPLFILTKELMDTIGHRYAAHLSRIGITSFG